MIVRIEGNIELTTLNDVKKYLCFILKLPEEGVKFVHPSGTTAKGSTEAENFFKEKYGCDLSGATGFAIARAYNKTLSDVKKDIEKKMHIAADSIKFVDKNNTEVSGNAFVKTFREKWED